MQVQMNPPGTFGTTVGIGGATPASPHSIADNTVVSEEGDMIVMKPDMEAMKRFKSLRELAPDSPAMTLFQDTIVLFIDLFKLSMASMLSVFVPQECPGSANAFEATGSSSAPDIIAAAVAHFKDRSDGCTTNPDPHDCEFRENFVCLSRFNKFVLTWNFLCLGVLIFHYFLVWRREHFLINNFKETLTLGRLHVRDIIADYPSVQTKLRKFNGWVFACSVFAILFQGQQ